MLRFAQPMFFVFGTALREQVRGLVADACPGCHDLRWLALVDTYRVFELYFIPLGKGRLQASTVRCDACGIERASDADRYAEVLSRTDADAIGVERAMPAHEAPRGLLERATPLLRELVLAGEDASRFIARFARFPQLADVERRELVAELTGMVTHLRGSRV